MLDRIKKIVEEKEGGNYTAFSSVIGARQNTLNQQINEKRGLSLDVVAKIASAYPDINPDWLLTGNGEMFKTDLPTKNYEYKGAPYYDVDFIGGFDLVLEDKTINPEYYIDLPPYNKPEVKWCNLYGKSMEPYIMSGDKIAIREVQKEDVIFGKAYGVITLAGLRTVKWIVRSPEKGCYRLVPENKDAKFGDYQDVETEKIFKIFLIMGAVRAF